MDDLLKIFSAPRQTFEKIKEKPGWIRPLVAVLVVVAITAASTVILTRDAVISQQEEAMREQGRPDEQIEQAVQLMRSPVFAVFGAIGGVVMIVILLLILSLVVNVLVPVFGGIGGFKSVFAVACHAALVRIPASILRLVLVVLTKSIYASASLVLVAPGLDRASFGYRVLSGFDLFVIWEMILVAIGISITNKLAKRNAYILVGLIFILSIFVGALLGGFGGRRT